MIIYLAILIPIITSLILFFFFHKRVNWLELLIPFTISIILIVIFKAISTVSFNNDVEYWGSYVVEARYYEPWNEMITRLEPVYDSKGNISHYRTVHEVIYHSARYNITDNINQTIYINRQKFEDLCHKFKNKTWINLHRNYHTLNGNLHVSKHNDVIEPVTTQYSYHNRILASHDSVFHYLEPTKEDKEQYQIFDYPKITDFYYLPSVLGLENKEIEEKLSKLNARLGHDKKIRIWLLIFQNQPLDAAIMQENYWQGGNKNELVICVGMNEEKIEWGHVFSWTPNENVKIEIRDLIYENKLIDLVDKIEPIIEESWVKRDFKEFNYLTVEPPWLCVFLTYFFTILVNIIVSCFVYHHNITLKGITDHETLVVQ